MERIKVVLIGNTSVGKSVLANRFETGNYEILGTGTDHLVKQININGKVISMDIWTVSGCEDYRSLYPFYYRDAHAIIIVFAVGNYLPNIIFSRDSFDSIEVLYKQIKENNKEALIILCGNMIDLPNREISFGEAVQKSRTLPGIAEYFETSSVTGQGIEEMFNFIAENVLARNQHKNDKSEEEKERKYFFL